MLEQSLHIVFQHKRIKGEWFELNNQDLIICDNIARHFDLFSQQGTTSRSRDGSRDGSSPHEGSSSTGRQPLFPGSERRGKATAVAASETPYTNDPLMQMTEANEKYLRDYSRVADDIRLGLTTEEIVELHEGSVSKVTIETVRRLLNYQTPNSQFLSQWFYIVNELEAGASENKILEKYNGLVTRTIIRTVRRILRNQLY